MSEVVFPVYVLSRHLLGGGGDDRHPCCICSDRKPEPVERINPPVYGYEVVKYVGVKNAAPENLTTAWGEQYESGEVKAKGPSREACAAYLRLIGAERVQDFTVAGATWNDPPKHWSELSHERLEDRSRQTT